MPWVAFSILPFPPVLVVSDLPAPSSQSTSTEALRLATGHRTAGAQAEAGRRPYSLALIHMLMWRSEVCIPHVRSVRTAPSASACDLSLQWGWGTHPGAGDGPGSKSTPTTRVLPLIHSFHNISCISIFFPINYIHIFSTVPGISGTV